MSSKYAIDCEMVESNRKSILARVSIVDQNGSVVLDEYVKPTGPVTDYREFVSGIKKRQLENGSDFYRVKDRVSSLIHGCILIGHSLKVDLDVLGLTHTERNQRDLANYEPFTRANYGQPVALKTLALKHLGRVIQDGEHDSVQDAKACMEIYKKFANDWERNYR
ncbi:unnamed protein product, partial [Brenthis ino]